MDTLTALNQKLRQLKNKKSDIQDKIDDNKKRKKELESIISRTTSIADDDYTDINTYCAKITDSIYDAIDGMERASTIDNAVSAAKESGSGSDFDISSALQEMRAEVTKVSERLNTLDDDLVQVKQSIETTKDKIWEEKQRRASEALSAAAKAISGGIFGG